MALDYGVRFVMKKAHRPQADGRDLSSQRLGADHQHPGFGRQLGGQYTGGTLCAGDDIVGGCVQTEVVQVAGDLVGAARRIVGDE